MPSAAIVVIVCEMTSAPAFTIAEPIALKATPPPDGETWTHPRREFFSELFGTEAVVNVAVPTLTPVIPARGCGTALIIAPGGGFHGLSINSEGFDVARRLAPLGVTSFVLEYRTVPGGDDPVAEMYTKAGKQTAADMARFAVLAGTDGIAAMQHVRTHATDFAVDATSVGVIGFSAGGNVALRVALADQPESRPDFVAAIYPSTRGLDLTAVPARSGPMFIVAATDDQLGLADDSVALYQAWKGASRSVELHLYANGGHGFGMRPQSLPSDTWIDRFEDWLRSRALVPS